jgi:hypothetical protein
MTATTIPRVPALADHRPVQPIDYDDNGVELYWDRPRQLWPVNAKGELAMFTHRLDLQGLLAEK